MDFKLFLVIAVLVGVPVLSVYINDAHDKKRNDPMLDVRGTIDLLHDLYEHRFDREAIQDAKEFAANNREELRRMKGYKHDVAELSNMVLRRSYVRILTSGKYHVGRGQLSERGKALLTEYDLLIKEAQQVDPCGRFEQERKDEGNQLMSKISEIG